MVAQHQTVVPRGEAVLTAHSGIFGFSPQFQSWETIFQIATLRWWVWTFGHPYLNAPRVKITGFERLRLFR